jgi:DNA-binding IclR family transcriptional regulator
MNSEVKSAGRILDLIEYLAGCTEPVALKQIVADLGYPKSSTHALTQTLVARGYAVQDITERYLLVRGSRHGSPARALEARLVSAAHPIMQELRDLSGETVLLSVLNGRGGLKRLAKSVSRQAIRYDTDFDAPSELYCTASGRVLLAHMKPAALDAYFAKSDFIAYTPMTVTDPAKLRDILARVLAEGVAVNDQEFIAGSTGIAAPIRAKDGRVVAVLNLGTVAPRFQLRRREIIAAVIEAANRVSARMGYAGPQGD